MINKVVFICTILIFLACKFEKKDNTTNTDVKQPNIIVIVVDDAGYVDFGFMGSDDLDTPEIDALANSGVKFTDAHVSATVCAPSRAGLMTGKYQQRFGFEANGTGSRATGDIGLSDDVVTMADVFKTNGYKTIALGKWHLGASESDHPNQRGFDEFYGFLTGSRSYFPMDNPSVEKMLQHNGEHVAFEGYMTDVLGDKSVDYIEENKDVPFFMYLAYNAVHTPMQAKEEHLQKYEGHQRQQLAAMTWSLDENVGKLRKKLKDLDLLHNTLIYFISDNGGAHNNQSSMGPLKGWKGNKFEGGHRIPFIVSWPAKIEGNQTFNGLSSSLDIFTTSLAAANIKKDKSLLLDGVNLLPYLQGITKGDPHDRLFWRKLEESAVRVGDYKLIDLNHQEMVMYNLKVDISETNDLSTTEIETFKSVYDQLVQWESKMVEPLWQEGRDWMDVTFHIHEQLMRNEEPKYKDPYTIRKNK